jgi:hypothetical protein
MAAAPERAKLSLLGWLAMVEINSVKFGEIRVSGKDYYSDVFVFWDGKVELKAKSHIICMDDMDFITKKKPDALVIGTGMQGVVKILPEVKEVLENRKIKLFMDETPNAIDIFNGLKSRGKKVVGIFHVTC